MKLTCTSSNSDEIDRCWLGWNQR